MKLIIKNSGFQQQESSLNINDPEVLADLFDQIERLNTGAITVNPNELVGRIIDKYFPMKKNISNDMRGMLTLFVMRSRFSIGDILMKTRRGGASWSDACAAAMALADERAREVAALGAFVSSNTGGVESDE